MDKHLRQHLNQINHEIYSNRHHQIIQIEVI